MALDNLADENRFIRDFNACAARYRPNFISHPAYVSSVFMPFEVFMREPQSELVDSLMSWMSAEQWHALERMGAEIYVEQDIRNRGTQVSVRVRHVDAEAVFANNSYVLAMILQSRGVLHNVPPGSLVNLRGPSSAAGAGGIRTPPQMFGEGRDLGPSAMLEVQPSVHMQEPAIPASSERRLALNHKLRGKKDVTHSETLSPRRVRKPKHRT